jgi:hypothetical protein
MVDAFTTRERSPPTGDPLAVAQTSLETKREKLGHQACFTSKKTTSPIVESTGVPCGLEKTGNSSRSMPRRSTTLGIDRPDVYSRRRKIAIVARIGMIIRAPIVNRARESDN